MKYFLAPYIFHHSSAALQQDIYLHSRDTNLSVGYPIEYISLTAKEIHLASGMKMWIYAARLYHCAEHQCFTIPVVNNTYFETMVDQI